MIQLENVSKTYQTDKVETIALHDINLLIDKGEFVSIMGPSGCGKSTLLNLLGLLDRPGAGKIKIAGEELHQWGDKALAKMRNKTFGFIFQSFHLINDLRVIDMYEAAIRHDVQFADRKGNWVQKFVSPDDAQLYATAQFYRYQEVERFLERGLVDEAADLIGSADHRAALRSSAREHRGIRL